jgi:drug/metabolite transporter (DMT)-like permease
LSGQLDTFEIMMYRSLIGIVIVVGIGTATGRLRQIRTNALGLHFVRNSLHFAGQNLWFYAVTLIPLSQLFAFEFTVPVWVALLAPFILGERMTPVRVVAALLGFTGILIVARPDLANLDPAVLAAALSAVGFAGTVLATKNLSRSQSTLCILFWLVSMQAVFGLMFAGFDGDITWPSATAGIWVIIVGFCGLLAHFCITTALTMAPATIVAPMDFLRLPLITVVGFWLYQEPLEWPVLIGALIVFWANILNIRAEHRSTRVATAS